MVSARHVVGGSDLHATAIGKVLLSGLEQSEAEALLRAHGMPRFTGHTITDIDRLRAELARVRAQGFAVCREEHVEDFASVAAPVRDATGRVAAGLGLAFPTIRSGSKREHAIATAVGHVAAEVSRRLGYRAPTPAPIQEYAS